MKLKHIAIVLDGLDQIDRVPIEFTDFNWAGTTIDLLIRTTSQRAVWMQANLTALERYNSKAVEACKQYWCFPSELQRKNAEAKLAPLRQTLTAKGANLQLRIYCGALKKALKDIAELRAAPLVVLRLRPEGPLAKLYRAAMRIFRISSAAQPTKAILEFRHATVRSQGRSTAPGFG